MESLKEQYNEILSRENATKLRIDDLKNNEIIKEYFTKVDELKSIQAQREELYRQMQFEKYSSCDHIWTLTYIEREEGPINFLCGCIKCGLDQRALLVVNSFIVNESRENQIMREFVKKNYFKPVEYTLECDLSLAREIYAKIKAAHPDIDDETALSYLKTALDDIRKIEVSDERKNSRVKRLSLKPNFSMWSDSFFDMYNNSNM